MSKTEFNFEIDFGTEEICDTVCGAIKLETDDKEMKRGKMTINQKGSALSFIIEADDIVAARSLFNSVLRVTKTSFDIVNIIDFNE